MASVYQHLTDRQLVAKLRQGEEAALSEIYERYWDRLFAVAANRLGDLQEAEECVQDVLYKLWRLRETLHVENDDLSAYLAIGTRNQVFNRRLKRHRERLRAAGYEITEARPIGQRRMTAVSRMPMPVRRFLLKRMGRT